MRDPRPITEQLDGLVSAAEETERGVKDMEDILSVEQDVLMGGSMSSDVEDELKALTETPRQAEPTVAAASPPRPRVVVPPVSPPPPPPPQRKKIAN
jgi:hypothetical protein